MDQTTDVYIIFDGPPGPESGRFVETESSAGRGLGKDDHGAEWKKRSDGLWALGPFVGVNAFDIGYAEGLADGKAVEIEPLLDAGVGHDPNGHAHPGEERGDGHQHDDPDGYGYIEDDLTGYRTGESCGVGGCPLVKGHDGSHSEAPA